MRTGLHRAWLLATLVLVTGLAGCLGDGTSPAAAPGAGPGVAVQPGVDDPVRRVVEVTQETRDGPPVPNATVVFFTPAEEWPQMWVIRPEELPCDDPTDLAASPHWEVLAVGTTDAEGRVVGLVDSVDANDMSVAVGGVDGWNTEVDVWGTTNGDWEQRCFRARTISWADGHQVTLYRSRPDVSIRGVTDPSASAAFLEAGVDLPQGLDDPVWDDRRLVLHPDPIANGWYAVRLDHLDLELTWNNTGADYADLYLAAGHNFTLEDAAVGSDHEQLPGSGASRETLTWDRVSWSTSEIRVGPATNATVASATGLAWRIQGTATITDAPVILPEVP